MALITIGEVFDVPRPDKDASNEEWSRWCGTAKKIGSVVVEECGEVEYRTTFEGPNHHSRAITFAQFAQNFRWIVMIENPKESATADA